MSDEAPAELRRPATLGPLEGRWDVYSVATIVERITAPPDRIYRILKGVAEGHGGEFEWAEVVARTDQRLLCDFWTAIRLPLGGRITFRTRETVELAPPDRLHYRHRSGPPMGLAETIHIEPLRGGESRVTYRAVYPSPWRWWGVLFSVVARPVAHVFMRIHFNELRRAAQSSGR